MSYMIKVESGLLAGYWIGFPTHSSEYGLNGHFSCDHYPEIGERNCKFNDKPISPVLWRRLRKAKVRSPEPMIFRLERGLRVLRQISGSPR